MQIRQYDNAAGSLLNFDTLIVGLRCQAVMQCGILRTCCEVLACVRSTELFQIQRFNIHWGKLTSETAANNGGMVYFTSSGLRLVTSK